jgi:hypothetical protein
MAITPCLQISTLLQSFWTWDSAGRHGSSRCQSRTSSTQIMRLCSWLKGYHTLVCPPQMVTSHVTTSISNTKKRQFRSQIAKPSIAAVMWLPRRNKFTHCFRNTLRTRLHPNYAIACPPSLITYLHLPIHPHLHLSHPPQPRSPPPECSLPAVATRWRAPTHAPRALRLRSSSAKLLTEH